MNCTVQIGRKYTWIWIISISDMDIVANTFEFLHLLNNEIGIWDVLTSCFNGFQERSHRNRRLKKCTDDIGQSKEISGNWTVCLQLCSDNQPSGDFGGKFENDLCNPHISPFPLMSWVNLCSYNEGFEVGFKCFRSTSRIDQFGFDCAQLRVSEPVCGLHKSTI